MDKGIDKYLHPIEKYGYTYSYPNPQLIHAFLKPHLPPPQALGASSGKSTDIGISSSSKNKIEQDIQYKK